MFSHEPLKLQTFWNLFDAAVNKNVRRSSLSGVQKFTYLRGQVQGDAARMIAGFPLTDDNFAHSIVLLQALDMVNHISLLRPTWRHF